MDPFHNVSVSHPTTSSHPQDALMVVDNRQLQLWNSLSWPQAPPHQDAAATLMELTASSSEVQEEEIPTSSASTSPIPREPEKEKKRVFKKRKATHTIRKEQKAALEQEIEQLQAQLEGIKFQALVQQGEAAMSYHDILVENAVLREGIQDQHLVMAQVRALLSGHTQHHMSGVRPMETQIRLSADRAERRAVLHALRGAKLREAKRFLLARSKGINPVTPYFQEERYETTVGDYCIVRFEISPLRGVKGGVRAVYDAVLQAAFNAEIIISETSGNITVREDDDQNDDVVSQMRLVSQTNRGVLLETNLVHFAEFSSTESDKSGQGCCAVTATDFVDEDELYPYRPIERIRRDAAVSMLLTSYVEPTAKGESELVVVVTRWSCARICHTDLNISHEAMLDIRQNAILSQNTFLNCVREALGLPVTGTTT